MDPKQPNSVERVWRKQPPWKGTPTEPLLLKLVPRSEPWASDAEGFRSYVWAEAQRIARDAGREPLTPARLARKLAGAHAQARARVETMLGEAEYQQALAEAERARWNARIQRMDVKAMRAAIAEEFGAAPPNKTRGSARLAHLLAFIRAVTGRPHFTTLARLLALAGWRVQPDALRMIVSQKPKK